MSDSVGRLESARYAVRHACTYHICIEMSRKLVVPILRINYCISFEFLQEILTQYK